MGRFSDVAMYCLNAAKSPIIEESYVINGPYSAPVAESHMMFLVIESVGFCSRYYYHVLGAVFRSGEAI